MSESRRGGGFRGKGDDFVRDFVLGAVLRDGFTGGGPSDEPAQDGDWECCALGAEDDKSEFLSPV